MKRRLLVRAGWLALALVLLAALAALLALRAAWQPFRIAYMLHAPAALRPRRGGGSSTLVRDLERGLALLAALAALRARRLDRRERRELDRLRAWFRKGTGDVPF